MFKLLDEQNQYNSISEHIRRIQMIFGVLFFWPRAIRITAVGAAVVVVPGQFAKIDTIQLPINLP